MGIKWFKLTEKDGEYYLDRVIEIGKRCTYAIGYQNDPTFDNERQ